MELPLAASLPRRPQFLAAGRRRPPHSSRRFPVTSCKNPPPPRCPLPPEKQEIFRSLEGWAEKTMLRFLKPAENCWQPQDFLPVPRPTEEFLRRVTEIPERAAGISDELYVCLVGSMITEEALPTYQSLLNTFHGVNDVTSASPTAWARWIRGWSAEENRHGDFLNKYLYLTGRLDMRQVEKTIQYLIGAGMDIGGDNNPFCGIIYVCFQERATFISHGNTAWHAKQNGDGTLAKICGMVAADEKRHEAAYTCLMSKLFEVDPDESVRALAHMMRMRVTMPAELMFDGCDRHLFRHFSAVAQRVGIYTAADYGDMLEFFLREWEVGSMEAGLSPEGRAARDYVCGLPAVIRKMAERSDGQYQKKEPRYVPFSWIFNKQVLL